MTEYLQLYRALSPAAQFWSAAVLLAAGVVLSLGVHLCWPAIVAGARDVHQDLFGPELEDDERRLVEARRHRRAAQRVPHQVDAGDERKLLDAITAMSSPSTRIH